MAWKQERPKDWVELRKLLIDIGDKGCLSCRGDPGGHDDILSSIDVGFRTTKVAVAVQPVLERVALERFIQQAAPHLPTYQLGILGGGIASLMLMRHYGGPTRLVDWSESVWISAFFAMQKDFANVKGGVIWVYDRHAYDEAVGIIYGHETRQALPPRAGRDPTYPGIFFPDDPTPFGNWLVHTYAIGPKFPRLIAQQGHFTLASRLGLDHSEIIDRVLSDPRATAVPCVPHTKIVIPLETKRPGLYALERMGITGASMYPGLDGVCAYLREFTSFGDLDRGVQRMAGGM